jgi:hypothetical protein
VLGPGDRLVLHTRELVRAATRAVTHACHGHGTGRTERQADNGADTDTASPPSTSDERG